MDRIITFFQRKRAVSLILIFAAFMLIQLVILRLGNKAGRGFIMPEHQELVYYGMQLPVILGFVLRSFVNHRAVKLTALGVCFAGFWLMLISNEASLFYLIVTGTTVLCLGYTGGCVYYYMSCFADVKHFGLCFGLGYAFAVAGHFFGNGELRASGNLGTPAGDYLYLQAWRRLRQEAQFHQLF